MKNKEAKKTIPKRRIKRGDNRERGFFGGVGGGERGKKKPE